MRSNSHCSGEAASAAANGSSSTCRSKWTCRFTIGLEPRAASASASTASGGTMRATVSCGTATMTASAACVSVLEQNSASFRASHRRARRDANARALERRRRRVAVQLLQRHGRDADVARVGRVEEPRAEDHRRERERSLRGGQVERRERDQVPELRDGGVGLLVRAEPFAERPRVERLVGGIELAERGGAAERVDAVAECEAASSAGAWGRDAAGRERRAAQERRRLAFAQHGDAQPRLDRNEVLDPEPCEEAAVGRAAAQKHVLSVVDPVVLAARPSRSRRRAAAAPRRA